MRGGSWCMQTGKMQSTRNPSSRLSSHSCRAERWSCKHPPANACAGRPSPGNAAGVTVLLRPKRGKRACCLGRHTREALRWCFEADSALLPHLQPVSERQPPTAAAVVLQGGRQGCSGSRCRETAPGAPGLSLRPAQQPRPQLLASQGTLFGQAAELKPGSCLQLQPHVVGSLTIGMREDLATK